MFRCLHTKFYGPNQMFHGPYTILYGVCTMFYGPYTMCIVHILNPIVHTPCSIESIPCSTIHLKWFVVHMTCPIGLPNLLLPYRGRRTCEASWEQGPRIPGPLRAHVRNGEGTWNVKDDSHTDHLSNWQSTRQKEQPVLIRRNTDNVFNATTSTQFRANAKVAASDVAAFDPCTILCGWYTVHHGPRLMCFHTYIMIIRALCSIYHVPRLTYHCLLLIYHVVWSIYRGLLSTCNVAWSI